MKKRSIAHIYATVLIDLCDDTESMNQTVSNMEAVNQMLVKNSLLKKTLQSQNLEMGEKEKLLNELFKGKLSDSLLKFLKIVVEKNLIGIFSEILSSFKRLVSIKMDKIIVRSITTVPLTENEKQTLYTKLQKASTSQIVLEEHIDPKILGGIRLMFSNNKMIDFSLKSKLERLKNMLTQKEMNHATES